MPAIPFMLVPNIDISLVPMLGCRCGTGVLCDGAWPHHVHVEAVDYWNCMRVWAWQRSGVWLGRFPQPCTRLAPTTCIVSSCPEYRQAAHMLHAWTVMQHTRYRIRTTCSILYISRSLAKAATLSLRPCTFVLVRPNGIYFSDLGLVSTSSLPLSV